MAVINTLVAKSSDVKDAALNLNAKAFEVRRTLAAVWALKSTGTKPPPPADTMSLDMKNEGGESVVGDGDERTLVEEVNFAPGGKYRSIVKLFIHYEFQKQNGWAMGTGWLISPDIFVTAGHCSYDWSHKMGRATEVKAYIGYAGHQSETSPNVQFRQVKKIVTTEGWVKTKGQKCFDVSFMQVDKPFTGITPFRFEETNATGNAEIGVVGYPGDLQDKDTKEKGARMYEMFLPTQWNLAEQADTMLEYQIDTFGGNSGSPVLRRNDLVSIGAHVYGGALNSASVIGKYGNPYMDYIAAFDLPVPNEGLNLIPVTGNTAIKAPVPSGFKGGLPSSMTASSSAEAGICSVCRTRQVDGFNSSGFKSTSATSRAIGANGYQATPQARTSTRTRVTTSRIPNASTMTPVRLSYGKTSQTNGQLTRARGGQSLDEEGFFDVLKTVARVGAPLLGKALNTALPVALGPIGGPVGALAGFALNAAGKLAESAEAESSLIDAPPALLHQGAMERAILAEATLMALESKELHHDTEESIFSDMKDSVMKVLPTIRKAAPHVMGAMMEPALRIALDSLHKYNTTAAGGAEGFMDLENTQPQPFRAPVYSQALDRPADRQAEAFLAHLQESMGKTAQESAMDGESEEGFFDILSAGIRFAGHGVLAVAKHGLPIIASAIGGGQESTLVDSPAQDHAFSADALAQRAAVAEAALQAVMKLPPEHLQEEGFFDFITETVKKIAPIALKVAPTVVSAINPTVGKIVKGVLGQESAMVGDNGIGGSMPTRRRLGAPAIGPRRSLANLRGAAERENNAEFGFSLNF